MRTKDEVKLGLSRALNNTVNQAFHKRGFSDDFSEEELEEIKEIDSFLKRVSLYRGEGFGMEDDYQFFFLCCKAKIHYYGKEISCFANKPIPLKKIKEEKDIQFYVAKAIYKLIKKKNIEVYYAVNTFVSGYTLSGRRYPQRIGECVSHSNAVFCDIDLPEEMHEMKDEDVLELLTDGYEEVFLNIPVSFAIRSGGGIHLYFELEQTVDLQSEPMDELWRDTMKCLQKVFQDFGADNQALDKSRLLRLPNSINRKEKYGEGKKVRIMYDSKRTYDLEDLNKKLHFVLEGGIAGLFEEIATQIDDITFYAALEHDSSFYDDMPEEDPFKEIVYMESSEINKEEIQKQTDDEELTEEEKTAIRKAENKKKLSELLRKKKKDVKYKGISVDYNSIEPSEFWQNRDLIFWILNRDSHDGYRHHLLFILGVNWYYIKNIKEEEQLKEKWRTVNKYLNPPLDDLEGFTKATYQYFCKKTKFHGIRNSTIETIFGFTEEEKQIVIGNYYSEEEPEKRMQKERQNRRIRYERYIHKKGRITKQERRDNHKQLLIDNPKMTFKEFHTLTGRSRKSFSSFRQELGIVGISKNLEKYIKFFEEEEDTSVEAFIDKFHLSEDSYKYYRRIISNLNK